ncbi:LysE family translocator [Chitinilyticum litopenaei]|uniref:LysE family translocator n=1 Tax=Chitinilyticum litopenaei TaxID=1121276 RepID=UPI00041AAABE|nr:LysE family translocator [Chitinilyticum litopenaei]
MIEWLAFASYIAVMSITPGPNNIMLASSGVNFGFRRTVPHIFGISLGCALQLALCTVALTLVLRWIGPLRLPFALAGCGYLLWLSWQLARAGAPGEAAGRAAHRPMSVWGAAIFQWINPKAWVMVVNTAILFAPAQSQLLQGAALLSLGIALINLPCISVWALAGDALRRQLQHPAALRIFNLTMAVLMGGTALWLLHGELLQAGAG